MKRFCHECGHSLQSEDIVCTNCGTKVTPHIEASKKQWTKIQKVYFSSIGVLVVLLIGLSIWTNAYFSKEAVTKRFSEAIEQKDAKALSNLIVHEDGTVITLIEAEALLKLVKSEGKKSIAAFSSVQPNGKFLGVFQKHSIEMIDQFAYFEGPVESFSFSFNNTKVKENDRGDYFILFGPLVPGIYDVESKFQSKFSSGTANSEVYLSSNIGEHTWIPVELPVSDVMFEIENYSTPAMKKVTVLVNDVEVPVDSNGVSETIGPILLDGSQKAKVIAEYPWGKVTSEEFIIESEHQYASVAIFTKEQQTELANLLLQFGEELAKSKATVSNEVFTTTTEKYKEELQKYTIDYYKNNDKYYSGQLEQVGMDTTLGGLMEDALGVFIMAEFLYKEADYSVTSAPEFETNSYPLRFELTYDEQQNKWFINDESRWYYSINATHVLKGSGNLYEPSSEVLKTAKEDVVKVDLQRFMESYVYSSVAAINYNSISYIENLVTKDGLVLKESKEYIAYLQEKGITEEVISVNVGKVEEKDTDVWEVTSTEEYRIYYPDKELLKKFNTVSRVKKVDGQWLVHELISTTEIEK